APDALARSRIQGQVAGAAPDQVTISLNSGQQTRPDANGFYLFEGLPAGTYTVVASVPDGQQRAQQASLSGTQLSIAGLDFSFAPGSDAFAPVAAPPTGDADFFVETGHTLRGALRDYWRSNGGLPVFGFPISEQLTEPGDDGQPRTVQYFERNRLELHPENAPPYNVQLGRLGDAVLRQQGRDWFGFAAGAPAEGCLFFAETQHALCEPFLSAWRSNGLELDGRRGKTAAESLALFGLPLSDAQIEQLPDGGTRAVQWFERARFEDHGPDGVLLGLLGRESTGR
ncbi:MAG: peptidase S8, partial [Roseiflexaceae bacterium]|nr:peptidase S8 [Roseiflexaceae bacterium]